MAGEIVAIKNKAKAFIATAKALPLEQMVSASLEILYATHDAKQQLCTDRSKTTTRLSKWRCSMQLRATRQIYPNASEPWVCTDLELLVAPEDLLGL